MAMNGENVIDYFEDFNPQMAATANRVPFDQNDQKYKCLCGTLHIKKGARIVAVLVNVLTILNIIFSLTRSSTVIVYTIMSASFSVVIFGTLLYGVWKEKRLYLYPYLFFQVLSICLSFLLMLVILISIAVGSNMIVDLAKNIGNIDVNQPQKQIDSELSIFTVLFILFICVGGLIQAYFVITIYAFQCFLKERENSFSFNFDAYSNDTSQSPTIFSST